MILSLIHDASSLMNGMILHITIYESANACLQEDSVKVQQQALVWPLWKKKAFIILSIPCIIKQQLSLGYNAKNPIPAKLQQFCRPSFERFLLVAMLRFPFNHFSSSVRFSPLSYIAYISQINHHGCQEPQMCGERKKDRKKGVTYNNTGFSE